jgi:hypothetical protein
MDNIFATLKGVMGDNYAAEGLAFRMMDRYIASALGSPTSAEGRAVLDELQNSDVLPVFDVRTRKRMQGSIDAVRLYLQEESTDTFTRMQTMYKHYGLNVVPAKGKSRDSSLMVTAAKDGVPYSLEPNDAYGHVDPTKITHNVKHYKLTVKRHHKEVKAVYDYLMQNHSRALGDVWVMMGGGSQLQAFFGNNTGYLGILHLSLESLKEQKEMEASGYLDACGVTPYSLIPNWAKNGKYFKGLQVPGVEVGHG